MAAIPRLTLLLLLLSFLLTSAPARAHIVDGTRLTGSASLSLEWPAASFYSADFANVGGDDDGWEEASEDDASGRRSLYWRAPVRYYISYGALSANRVPCPPRSGRSYYTHNCFKARGPVHPYYRGCSSITRCRR